MKPNELLNALLNWHNGELRKFYTTIAPPDEDDFVYNCFGVGSFRCELTNYGEAAIYHNCGYLAFAFPNVCGGRVFRYTEPKFSFNHDSSVDTAEITSKLIGNRWEKTPAVDDFKKDQVDYVAEYIFACCKKYIEMKKQLDMYNFKKSSGVT